MRITLIFCVFACLAGIVTASAQSFDIQEFTSGDGHDVWLVEDHSNPIVTLEINFAGGSYLDPKGLEGVGQIMGWLLNEGAGDMSAEQYQGVMSDESFSIAADTGFETTSVSVQYLTENQDLVMEMLALALSSPRFDQDAIGRAKDYFANQVLQRMNGPGEEFSSTFAPLQYGADHPFLRYGNGTLESLQAITRDDIAESHRRIYVTDGVQVNAVGDIGPAALSAAIDQVLGVLPTGSAAPKRPAPSTPQGQTEVVVDFAQPVTFVMATADGITFSDADLSAARIADQILGGEGFNTRLYKKIREEEGLVYSIGSSLAASRDFGRIGFTFQTANDSVDEALGMALEVVREFAANGPTQAEVDQAIALITGSYPLRFQTSRDIVNYMNTMRVLDLPTNFPTVRNQQYLNVTLDDVRRVANRLYSNAEFLIGMVGRPENRVPGVRQTKS